ncbi:MAG TPA: nitroreductase/quinone reductase family protein [Thermoleophilaceae bacterium]
MSATKARVARTITNRLVNPFSRWMAERGLLPGTAVLETIGRKSGLARRTPVGNGLRGDTFWIITEHGHRADYVKNIQANPRVRVKAGHHRWRAGTAQILENDDYRERMRMLHRRANDSMVRLMGTEHLTIRVDLDPDG